MRFLEERREWILLGLWYADDLVLCGESEEDLKVMMGHIVEMCRRYFKINANKSKMIVLSGEEGLEYDIHMDGL